MCLDISFYSSLELIDSYFPGLVHDGEIDFDLDMGVHVMAMGHKRYPVITLEAGGNYHRKLFEWGVIAEYMNTPEKIKTQRKLMVNARSEKMIGEKKSFWYRIRKKRCLIPVTAIYEHREVKGWEKKIAYHIQLKDRTMFCIPGLYHFNMNLPSDVETGEVRGMFTMVTRPATGVMKQIHNSGENAFRMPLFLPKELELKWLDPNLTDEELGQLANYEMPSEELSYYTVESIRSRTPRADGKRKNEPFNFPGLPPLGNDNGPVQQQTELFT